MRYYIYIIKAGITALSENTESQIKMTVRTSNIIASGDRIIGFCENPISEYRYIFNGLSMSNGKITLSKVLQILNGVKSNSLLPELENKIKEEIVSGNDLIEISEEHYKTIESAILNQIGTSLNKSTSKTSNPIIPYSHNRIIFGAPGTGKSKKLEKQAEEYFYNSMIKNKEVFIDELLKAINGDSKGGSICSLAIKYAKLIPFDYDSVNALVKDVLQSDGKGKDVENVSYHIGIGKKCAENLHLDYSFFDSMRYERVTFHPNYSYSQFVGTYKPIMKTLGDSEELSYEYVPGPFIRTYIKAKKTEQNVLLLIEEINRANVAAVFGDVFQLLDRDEQGDSEYPITTSEDLRKFLAKSENLGGKPEDYKTISIPSNMYIWATMNSADQGVFPMDTAFKRRWEFEYIGIDDNKDQLVYEDGNPILIPIPSKNGKLSKEELHYDLINWNKIRTSINNKLIELNINEDKFLGPFFIGLDKLRSAKDNPKDFIKNFESKVLMYLFDDAAKMRKKDLFKVNNGKYIYSEICNFFETDGLEVFNIDNSNIVKDSELANNIQTE